MPVGRLYNKQKGLNRLNHCKPRISATGTLWHNACILIRVHTFHTKQGRTSGLSGPAVRPFLIPRHPGESRDLVETHRDFSSWGAGFRRDDGCGAARSARLRDLLLVEQLLELAGL